MKPREAVRGTRTLVLIAFVAPLLLAGSLTGAAYSADLTAFSWDAYLTKVAGSSGTPPVTTLTTEPAAPNENDWFNLTPDIVLSANEPVAATQYQWDSTVDNGWQTYTGSFTGKSGLHTLYYRSVGQAGDTEEIRSQAFKVDTVTPDGAVKINGGATYTRSSWVNLSISASDGPMPQARHNATVPGSGIWQMRLSNNGTSFSPWASFLNTKTGYPLATGSGWRKAWVDLKDRAGNWTTVSDSIFVDLLRPQTKLYTPRIISRTSSSAILRVDWLGTDPYPASGIGRYTIEYKAGAHGYWKTWKRTSARYCYFSAARKRLYYFRVRSYDRAGNPGYLSPVKSVWVS